MLISASGNPRPCWLGEKLQSVVSCGFGWRSAVAAGPGFFHIAPPEMMARLCLFTGLEKQHLRGD
jgi:hypothetical protein